MKAFGAPGIAVAIVKDGRVILAKGYGVRSLNSRQKVDENTLFGIASTTKAFTAAAFAILVDEGKLTWDDKVIQYIPEFRMYDQYVTSEFTIRDLLTHRSGLRPFFGDLLHDPDGSDFAVEDIIHSLRYFKPVSPFRSTFAYDNNLYIVAGEIVARVSGMRWEEFIERRILSPLQMEQSAASYHGVKDRSNIIDAHSFVDGVAKVVPRYESEIPDAAGGIYSSASDLTKWVLMLLNDGKYGDGLNKQLFSETAHGEMWSPQTIVPVGRSGPYNTHFGAYGLGWFLIDAKGYKEVFHSGQDIGMESEIALIPELKLGIVVLANLDESKAVGSIVDQITDSYLGIEGTDRVKENADSLKASQQMVDEKTILIWKEAQARAKSENLDMEANAYAGTYRDDWFGDVQILVSEKGLWFRSKRSPQLTGRLVPYQGGTFVIKWEHPIAADAFVLFGLDEKGKAESISMKPISPAPSDFPDLDFHRVE